MSERTYRQWALEESDLPGRRLVWISQALEALQTLLAVFV
jgi:hypothetical protein